MTKPRSWPPPSCRAGVFNLQVACAAQEWGVDLDDEVLAAVVLARQGEPLQYAVRLGELLPATREVHVAVAVV